MSENEINVSNTTDQPSIKTKNETIENGDKNLKFTSANYKTNNGNVFLNKNETENVIEDSNLENKTGNNNNNLPKENIKILSQNKSKIQALNFSDVCKNQGTNNNINNQNNSKYKTITNEFKNNYQNKGCGHGRGRGFLKNLNNKADLLENKIKNKNTSNTEKNQDHMSYKGRGKLGNTYLPNDNYMLAKSNKIHKKNLVNKAEYIPPDIENDVSNGGIEAGLNFDKYNTIEVNVSGNDVPKRMGYFENSSLNSLILMNLNNYNFKTPTPIQNYSIPIILSGRDIIASAQTGSGKTAAFVLPILQNLLNNNKTELIFDQEHCEPQVIILAPTRELTIQICESVWKFSKGTSLKNGLLYGGTSINHQKFKLLQNGVHVLIATPGRLNDFVKRGIVIFSSLQIFVLDEADRMLDMGFKTDIDQILNHTTMPAVINRQTLMFSATLSSDVQQMAKSYLNSDYIFVVVGEIGGACKDVVQTILKIDKFEKKKKMCDFLKEMDDCRGTIVFVEQKRTADFIAAYLSESDFPTTSIHGDREQPEREQALRDFKTNKMKILVATAVAARGLDIKGVNYVVNFDMPKTIDEYVHRIGRTGRLGNAGKAISFYDPESDRTIASELIRILERADQEVPSWLKDEVEILGQKSLPNEFNDIRQDVEKISEFIKTEEEEW
ncbi:ATP-dependent RNA helicase vasa-like isoform X2 [Daktulosphaira vitifoliae]|nr:ATP-dependent RNA helicase vasa-like isoform X2 [Daktulosphaira vitifoliae]XP_050533347.1 ATP-dependent RNA helicase vasa-like isoform X2 [Daktulosphaira vitifoliae]XP_050533348.1 ATP-dependent RNA helicase vasa-like isoform X2 [Daktulosphaira vitifoliae]XP_050533349.1 ATP-dependent RNA helicase vasa-like isoform X2 [Daktulosphaira vitifoliae]